MFSMAVWLAGLTIESLILIRAVREAIFWRYPLFFGYLTWVFALSSVRLVFYLAKPEYYKSLYWYTQHLSVLVGCGVVWEIYRQALGRYPGAARMARNLMLFLLLMVFSKLVVAQWNGSLWSYASSTAELERNLRAVQGILLGALILVLAYYAIPLGKNVKGMILGYGIFISTSVVDLTLRLLLGDSFQRAWQYLQPTFYLLALVVWGTALWSYQAAPSPAMEPRIEADYQILAARTRERLFQVRAHLTRVLRP